MPWYLEGEKNVGSLEADYKTTRKCFLAKSENDSYKNFIYKGLKQTNI